MQYTKVVKHLENEEAFRKKVFNRETKEVMQLIDEYESLNDISEGALNHNLKYSELLPDLEFLLTMMNNA